MNGVNLVFSLHKDVSRRNELYSSSSLKVAFHTAIVIGHLAFSSNSKSLN